MIGRRPHRWLWVLTMLAATGAAGCESGFVTDAARGSLASFINSVLSTAVNETVGP